jgi:hypothetical protein
VKSGDEPVQRAKLCGGEKTGRLSARYDVYSGLLIPHAVDLRCIIVVVLDASERIQSVRVDMRKHRTTATTLADMVCAVLGSDASHVDELVVLRMACCNFWQL